MVLHEQSKRPFLRRVQRIDWRTAIETQHSLLVAAQDQGLNTNSAPKNIYQQVDSNKWKLWGIEVENFISACGMLVEKIQVKPW